MQLTDAVGVLKHLGVTWASFRVRYAWQKRTGALARRSPVATWDAIGVPLCSPLGLFPPTKGTRGGATAEADKILAGCFRLFGRHEVEAGLFPNWHGNPLTGEVAPGNVHWSAMGDFAQGDIKVIWELSRFPWAFVLARAYARTNDPKYAARFWALFDDWLGHNPPNQGPQWMCGQEATFRLIAATFARDVVESAASTTPARSDAFARFVLVTGRRIRANIAYALSQSNNHGISECVGLITAAALLPAVAEREEWHRFATNALRRQLQELVYPDGGFAQHSAVYHRVLLHDLLWCMIVLGRSSNSVPEWLSAATERALHFAECLTNPDTGIPALYGANDGSNVLPLYEGEFLDFRPTIQAASVLLRRSRAYGSGPWDEMTDWLCPGTTPNPRLDTQRDHAAVRPARAGDPVSLFRDAGCLTWQTADARLFFRCPTRFRHRPSQVDLLHVDICWRNQLIAHDAGTFSYNATGIFAGAFKSASVHNSVTFDGREPMRSVGRFLLLPWPRGRAGWGSGDRGPFAAEHDAWKTIGVRHQRSVSSPAAGEFAVCDCVTVQRPHRVRLHWLLLDVPYSLQPSRVVLHTPAGQYSVQWTGVEVTPTIIRASSDSDRGWWSRHYLEAEPALSLALEFGVEAGSTTFTTHFAPCAVARN